jgi:hypothetical protein
MGQWVFGGRPGSKDAHCRPTRAPLLGLTPVCRRGADCGSLSDGRTHAWPRRQSFRRLAQAPVASVRLRLPGGGWAHRPAGRLWQRDRGHADQPTTRPTAAAQPATADAWPTPDAALACLSARELRLGVVPRGSLSRGHRAGCRDNPCHLPCINLPMLRGPALAFCKQTAAALFPRKPPDVWAPILPPSVFLHVLVACAPNNPAPAGYAWLQPAEIVAGGPEAGQWLQGAADAVAAVRSIPFPEPPPAPPTGAPGEPILDFSALQARVLSANEALRQHLLYSVIREGLLREWADRIPRACIHPDVATTTIKRC